MDKYNNINEKVVSLTQMETDCEFLLASLVDSKNPLAIQTNINQFFYKYQALCNVYIQNLDFKNSYHICRRCEKLLVYIFQQTLQYDAPNFPIKFIVLNLLDPSINIESFDLTKILKQNISLEQVSLPGQYLKDYQFLENLLRYLIISLNNEGAIYMLRDKPEIALGYLIKAAIVRSLYRNSCQALYQFGIINLNIGFCLKQMIKYDRAIDFINKGIQIIETIDNILKQNSILEGVSERSSVMMNLIEFLYNKEEKQFFDSSATERSRIIYALAVSYDYLAEMLEKKFKEKEQKFCEEQADLLYKKYQKLENQLLVRGNQPKPLTESLLKTTFPQEKKLSQSNFNDNFSQYSLKSTNTIMTFQDHKKDDNPTDAQFIQPQNIIFKKYMISGQNKYKLLIAQIEQKKCLEIMLYSKPINFYQKVIIGFRQLLEFSNSLKKDINIPENFEFVLKELSTKVLIVNGELKLKGFDTFESIENFVQESQNPIFA